MKEFVTITLQAEIDADYFDELKRIEHHAEYLLDLENHPEIHQVWGVHVEKQKD